MGSGNGDIRTDDGLLVVSPIPGRRWHQMAAGAILLGVPLARVIDGPGGLAPPAITSGYMAFLGVAVLGQWLMLQSVGEQLRKGLKDCARQPDGHPLSVRPTFVDAGRAGPVLVVLVEDHGAPFGWVGATPLHPAFVPRAPYVLAGEFVPGKVSLLRSRPTGQAIVGTLRRPEQVLPLHPLATHAEHLLGWAPPGTLGGADGFAPVAATPTTGSGDPLLLRAAVATQGRKQTLRRTGTAIAVVAILVLMGNATGTAGLVVCASLVALTWAVRPARRWADKPLANHLATATSLPAADARTLAQMLANAGLGLLSEGPPS